MFQPIHTSGGFSPSLLSTAPAAPAKGRPAPSTPAAASAAAEAAPEPVSALSGLTEAAVDARVAAAEAAVREALSAEIEAARAEATQKLALAEALLEALAVERTQQLQDARAQVGALVLETVRRLVGEQPFLRDRMLRTMLDDAAGHLLGEREVVLRVRTDQGALARGLVADRVGWTVREDATITAGLRVEAARGTLDATLGTALEGISEAIDDWLEGER